MFEVMFPLFPRALMTGISGPCEMLQAAESLRRTRHSPKTLLEPLCLVRIATSKHPVTLTGGIQIHPELTYSETMKSGRMPPAWVILPPVWGNPFPAIKQEPALLNWLKWAHESGSLLIATGTSVCFLAEANLLNDIPVTTHWYFFDRFRRLYPELDLNPHPFLTYGNHIYCAGSINALSDLILYLIEQHYGEAITRIVERHFSHELKRHYDKPFFVRGGTAHHDEDIVRAQEWCHQHWQEDFSLETWASAIPMTVRTFIRRFRAASGLSPNQYVLQLRVQQAMALLKDTNLPIHQLAELCGFHDANYFSRQFRLRTDLSPSKYRQMVRAKPFSLGGSACVHP